MMNYKTINPVMEMVIAPTDSGKMTVDILETTTDQVIMTDVEITEAKKLCRHFNMGGGFDGFTPTFFLYQIKQTGA